MGARWYDPATATFLTRDSVPGELATPASLNAYTYAWADPLNTWDPDGHWPTLVGAWRYITNTVARLHNGAARLARQFVAAPVRAVRALAGAAVWAGRTLTRVAARVTRTLATKTANVTALFVRTMRAGFTEGAAMANDAYRGAANFFAGAANRILQTTTLGPLAGWHIDPVYTDPRYAASYRVGETTADIETTLALTGAGAATITYLATGPRLSRSCGAPPQPSKQTLGLERVRATKPTLGVAPCQMRTAVLQRGQDGTLVLQPPQDAGGAGPTRALASTRPTRGTRPLATADTKPSMPTSLSCRGSAGPARLACDELRGETRRRLRQPRVDDGLAQRDLVDDLQLHEDGRVAVEMRDREEAREPGLKDGFLLAQVLDAEADDLARGRLDVPEAPDVGLGERPLPGEHLAADLPSPPAAALALVHLGQFRREPGNVVEGCHQVKATGRTGNRPDRMRCSTSRASSCCGPPQPMRAGAADTSCAPTSSTAMPRRSVPHGSRTSRSCWRRSWSKSIPLGALGRS